jgi:DNA-binding MarR family transcriptional regulator
MKRENRDLEGLIFDLYALLHTIVKEKNNPNMEKKIDHDITESQIRYLKAIDKLRLPTLSELTREMGYSKASVSISIKKLEKKGYIKKRQSGTDKRSYYLIITGRGVNCVQAQRDIFKEYTNYIMEQLSDQEQNQLVDIIEKIIPPLIK